MSWIEALILGIIQGLTEFLPVSSSGHLEIGKVLLGVEAERSLVFTVVVHGATVLSTIVVFRKELLWLLRGLFRFRWNEETKYIFYLLISMVPVGLVALFLKDELGTLFSGNLALVGSMLLVTALLLAFTKFFKAGIRNITLPDALVIGVAQAVAVIPGISRSGATIATGLMMGNRREEAAKFSFLMVLIPILGENVLSLMSGELSSGASPVPITALMVGFLAAFVTGFLACRWMIQLVRKGNLVYFAIYCVIIGLLAIGYSVFGP